MNRSLNVPLGEARRAPVVTAAIFAVTLAVTTAGPAEAGDTLATIRSRGILRCGVNATTVVLLAPIIIRTAIALEVDFVGPMIVAAIISNSAGMLTLVGDRRVGQRGRRRHLPGTGQADPLRGVPALRRPDYRVPTRRFGRLRAGSLLADAGCGRPMNGDNIREDLNMNSIKRLILVAFPLGLFALSGC